MTIVELLGNRLPNQRAREKIAPGNPGRNGLGENSWGNFSCPWNATGSTAKKKRRMHDRLQAPFTGMLLNLCEVKVLLAI